MNSDGSLIAKKVLHAGTKGVDFKDGTKVFFHYQTRLCNSEHTVIDDSRKVNPDKPMELVLGKKFKFEVWEALVQKMALNEVSEFTVDKSLVQQYPFISRTLRDHHAGKQRSTHTCAMTIQTEGIGYDDLNDLLNNPQDLQFIIELVKVLPPTDYEKETWQMDESERLKEIPQLKEKGNNEFKIRKFDIAGDFYSKAIGMLEGLMLQEKPHTEEWDELNEQKMPLLLNFAQCKLMEGDFYTVIEHCTTVINHDPNNVKALFRRAKAHVGAWNPKEAKEDFTKVLTLEPSLTSLVKRELQLLEEEVKKKDEQDKQKLKNLFN